MGLIKKLNKKKPTDTLYVHVYHFHLKLMHIPVCWVLMATLYVLEVLSFIISNNQ